MARLVSVLELRMLGVMVISRGALLRATELYRDRRDDWGSVILACTLIINY